jgi:hypothetical protein
MKRMVSFRVAGAFTLFASVFTTLHAHSQIAVVPIVDPAPPLDDKSFYLDQPVLHPEEISGVWEAPDGHGGAIGINLLLHTTVPGDAATLAGVSQSWQSLEVGLYQRTGAALVFGDENFFGDSLRGGSVRYKDGRLTLTSSKFDLDLVRINRDTWSGRLHRFGFDSTVTLTRSTQPHSKARPSFVGIWKTGEPPFAGCIHIAEQASDALIGWEDSLTTPGAVRYGNSVHPSTYPGEHYGEMLKLSPTEDGNLSIESNAIGGLCCAHLFYATLSSDGTVMKANSPAGPNQSPHRTEWEKMPGDTCIVTPANLPSRPRNSDSQCPPK